MTINQLLTLKTNPKNNDLDNFLPILDLKNISKNKKIVSNPNSFVDHQLKLIYGSDFLVSPDDCDLIILSEPNVETISTEEVSAFLEDYFKYMNIAKTNDIVVIHISSSNKWLGLFEEKLLDANIPVYLNESEQTSTFLEYEKTININPFLPLFDFQHYSNEINKSIIIDLTLTSNSNRTYRLNFTKLINNIKGFDSLLIIINRSSTIPRLSNTKTKVIFEDEIDSEEFKHSTYVYVHTEEPYSLNSVNKVMYYAANSKVVFSNYNYYLNNTLPSIVMNLSRSFYDIRPFSDKEAFDILNESRNSIMYHYSFLNVLNEICINHLETNLINPFYFSSKNRIDNNIYMTQSEDHADVTIVQPQFNDEKYDLEKTLLFPILFLGYGSSMYKDSSLIYNESDSEITIPFYDDITKLTYSKKNLSMVIPIHNNGKYLKYKCFNSILKLRCLDNLEIIFVNDGSSDFDTVRIIKDLLVDYPQIIYHEFEEGSGSASRPRNHGMDIAQGEYITFLDPDNEAIENGYSNLLSEMVNDSSLDMVVGNIVREDNIKRNEISFYNKLIEIQDSPTVINTRKTLLKLNLSVQSIQAIIFKKRIIEEFHLKMVEGAAGQDTLFFQELFIKCNKVKVLNTNVHSYYAYVEGSVTNTVTHKFFEKFFKVEKERIKFLEKEDLIDHYMNVRFNSYMKNWYYLKFYQLKTEFDRKIAYNIIQEIYKLYADYSNYFDTNLLNAFTLEMNKQYD